MKPSSYQAWADSFQFSDDLKALETMFHQEQQKALKHQVKAQPLETGPQAANNQARRSEEQEEGLVLDVLSVKIATRLAQFLSEPEVFAHYLKLQELREDNELMAQQIVELMKKNQAQEAELEHLRQAVTNFRQVMGNVYLRSA